MATAVQDNDEVREEENELVEDEEEEEAPDIVLTLQNFVSTAHLGCKIDLERVAQTARNAEYNPSRFNAAIMRIREPRTTALVFANGKMIVTGAKRGDLSEQAATKFKNILARIGFPVTLNDFTIHNITATFDTGFPIRLEGLIHAYSSFATYEPELFPGLVYRMTDPRVSLMIFVSGKVVITGAKSVEAIQQAVDSIWEILCEFRKKSIVVTPVAR